MYQSQGNDSVHVQINPITIINNDSLHYIQRWEMQYIHVDKALKKKKTEKI